MARRPSTPPKPPVGWLWGFDADGGNSPALMTEAWFRDRFNEGFRVYGAPGHSPWSGPGGTPGPWTYCQTLFANALNAGFELIYLYGRYVESYDACIDAAGTYVNRLCMFQLDVEDPGHPLLREHVDGAKNKLISVGSNAKLTIYSGKGMWGNMGMSGDWSDVRLMEYAGEVTRWPADPYGTPINQFGGWNDPAIPESMRVAWQMRMSRPVKRGGVLIDEDMFQAAFLKAN